MGSWDPGHDVSELVVVRQREQRAAARVLGATGECVFLGWPDGELESGLRQRWEVAHAIRRLRPDVVLGHDPWKRYRLHPDHRHAGLPHRARAWWRRATPLLPGAAPPHHRPSALLLFEADEPDHVESTPGGGDVKIAALEAHASQLHPTMGIDPDATPEEANAQRRRFHDRIRAELAEHGALEGVPEGEAFKLIDRL
jgi:LmbE family N-acetylglucosaminyl deacetylase